MWRWVMCGALVVACGGTEKSTTTVSAQLASQGLRLPRSFVPSHYRARLAIDPERKELDGEIVIEGDIAERVSDLWLHAVGLGIVTAELAQAGRSQRLTAAHHADVLQLHPSAPVEPGRYTLTINYRGWINREASVGAYRTTLDDRAYVVTQLEPTHARRVFPCFDEPGIKVRWQLTLEVPRDHVAVSNAPRVNETVLDDRTKRVEFAETRPLPSYLIAFGVGPFDVIPAGATRAGKPIRLIVPRGTGREATWVIESTVKLIGLLEGYFAMPYPYPKLDLLATPAEVPLMENPGLVMFPSRLMLHDPDRVGLDDRLAWVKGAAHELAHQWFGDAVTAAWWDDLWLGEGFATWLTDKMVAAADPRFGGDTVALPTRWEALLADRDAAPRSIRQPIVVADDIGRAFDGITYEKSASVLAMFERAVGAEVFRAGVRAYIVEHRDGSATAVDFLAALSRAAGRDLAPAFQRFLDQPGLPIVRAELRCRAGLAPVIELSQRRYLPRAAGEAPGDATWQFPVCVAFDDGGARGEACTELTAARGELALSGKACPAWLYPNAGGRGYYRTAQPAAAIIALRDRGWSELTAMEHATAHDDLVELARDGEADLAVAMALVPSLVASHELGSLERALAAAELVRHASTAEQRPRIDAWIRATFGPAARLVGWQPRPSDDLTDAVTREKLVALVAASGDPVLRAAAVDRARAWRALPSGYRFAVLSVAADADRATFLRLFAVAPIERDPEWRRVLLRVLARVADPRALRGVLGFVLDPRFTLDESSTLVGAIIEPAQQRVAAGYLRAHPAELRERFPDAPVHHLARLAWATLGGCDALERDADVAFVRATFGRTREAAREIDRAVAYRDRCVDRGRPLAEQISAWVAQLPP